MNQPLTPRRAFAFASVSLDDIRTVKTAFGVTMNDVALALSAHVIRTYLIEHDELPDRPLVGAIPVGVNRGSNATSGNFVAATVTCLHTDLADPVDRLLAIHASMQSAKGMQSALGDNLVIDTLAVFPPAAIAAGLRLVSRPRTRVGAPTDLQRHHLERRGTACPALLRRRPPRRGVHARAPALGMRFNITLVSYQNHVDFGIATCPDVIADGWLLADGIPGTLRGARQGRATTEPCMICGKMVTTREARGGTCNARFRICSGSSSGTAVPSPVVRDDGRIGPAVPLGRRVELAGRGTMFIREVAGPPGRADAGPPPRVHGERRPQLVPRLRRARARTSGWSHPTPAATPAVCAPAGTCGWPTARTTWPRSSTSSAPAR